MIIWYYARCVHIDPESSYFITCDQAFQRGYECTDENESQIFVPCIGRCLDCKVKALALRQSILRKRHSDQVAAMNLALQFDEGNWIADESEDEAPDTETVMSQSPRLTRTTATDRVGNRAIFHGGPAQTPTLVQPEMSHYPCSASIEYAGDDNDDCGGDEEDYGSEHMEQESQGRKIQTWRSWIPIPSRLIRGRPTASLRKLVSDKDISDAEPLLATSKSKKKAFSRIPRPVMRTSEQ